MSNTDYGEAVRYIEGLAGKPRIGLPALRSLLARLSPEGRTYSPRVIHVAGTNGKGSVTGCLSLVLERAGFKVGTFTSPHLTDIRERIRVNGEDIPREDFVRCCARVRRAVEREACAEEPGYFAFLFLMALYWFAEQGAEVLVLETGIGGRLDATNALERKDLAVITRIDLDHTAFLGNTPGAIAGEKAGIFREGTPAVCLADPPEAFAVLRERALELGAPLYAVERAFYTTTRRNSGLSGAFRAPSGIDFSMRCRYDDRVWGEVNVPLFVHARYQGENMALVFTACLVLRSLGCHIPDEAVRSGLSSFAPEGRMQELVPGFFVDGAHNPGAFGAFLEEVRDVPASGERILVFSAMRDKDFGRELAMAAGSGLFGRVCPVLLESGRAVDAGEIRGWRERWPGLFIEEPAAAGETVSRLLPGVRAGRVTVFGAGSLYLVGELIRLVRESEGK